MQRITNPLIVIMGVGILWNAEAQVHPSTSGNQQLQQVLSLAQESAEKCSTVMERWIAERTISKHKLFSYLYYPLPNTTPPKFSTDYSKHAEKDIQPILERYLSKGSELLYVVMVDKNGYMPAHNLKYSATLTGDRARDFKQNLTMRIFNDRVGLAAARNQAPYLLQQTTNEEGQSIMDLSVPLIIGSKHWGAIRIGYKTTDTEATDTP